MAVAVRCVFISRAKKGESQGCHHYELAQELFGPMKYCLPRGRQSYLRAQSDSSPMKLLSDPSRMSTFQTNPNTTPSRFRACHKIPKDLRAFLPPDVYECLRCPNTTCNFHFRYPHSCTWL